MFSPININTQRFKVDLRLNLGLPTDNIYKLFLVLGIALYAYSHQFANSSVEEYEMSWLNRTELYYQLDEIEDKNKQSQQWHYLRASDDLDAKLLKRDAWSYLLMGILSVFLMGWGGHRWLFKYQPLQDKKDCLECEKREHELEQAKSTSNRISAWQRVKSFLLR